MQIKRIILLSFILSNFISCNQSISQDKGSYERFVPEENLIPYKDFLAKVISEKGTGSVQKQRFFKFINLDIPNYWTGTTWDYNGTTREPKVGNIACGYFVTNVLIDFGFDIERVFLAQQASSVMIKQLCEPSSVKYFNSIEKVKTYLMSRSEKEIYIAGLDFHTGFIIRENDKMYFLHSVFIDNAGVIKEELDDSKGFASKSYMIGSLSENKNNFKR